MIIKKAILQQIFIHFHRNINKIHWITSHLELEVYK